MRWTFVFVALLGFALVNTAILGYNAYSSASAPGGVGNGSTATLASGETATQISGTSSSYSPTFSASQTTQASSSSSLTNSSATQGAVRSFTAPVTRSGDAALGGIFGFLEQHSLVLAPTSWFAVGGMWIWRGRLRSKWRDLGFDSDVFTLFVRMKGAKTRIRLLDALSVPKDRLQLAEELDLDWKSVDRHVSVMKKYGFLDDNVAYGRVRMYRLTPAGVSLLKLLQELSTEEKGDETDLLPAGGEA